MKKTTCKRKVREPEEPWADALDVKQFDRALARLFGEPRRKRHLNLSRAGRSSGMSRQGWRKVERRKASPMAHSEVMMCNALRLRHSKVMEMVEDWLEQKWHPWPPRCCRCWSSCPNPPSPWACNYSSVFISAGCGRMCP